VWGEARSLGGLRWLLSARTFAEKAAIVHRAASPTDLPFVLMEEVEIASVLLALAGGIFLARRQETRLALTVVGVAWAGAGAAAMVGGFDPLNPDIRGYLGAAIALTAVLAGAGLGTLFGVFRHARLAPVLAGLVLLGAATRVPKVGVYPDLSQAR